MIRTRIAVTCAALLCGSAVATVAAQGTSLDTTLIALTYHKETGDPLDLKTAAQYSPAVQAASNFDRDDVMKREMGRIQSALDAADTTHEFVVRVNDNISEYDHARGEFAITLFNPGYSVPFVAFSQRYQLVFANAAAVRAIPMPKDQARQFDASLNSFGRQVVDEIHFRVVGAGDPSGAVTGPRVVRAVVTAAKIMDPSGRVVATPNPAAATTQKVAVFDAAAADVAGLRVGTKADDLAATLKRLYGDVTREPITEPKFPGLVGTLTVNDMGCFAMPGGSKPPVAGAVCVTARVDGDGIVRTIEVERVFPWMDQDVFRAALVQKYGPVAAAQDGGVSFALGWGPTVPSAVLYDSSGPQYALTAAYMSNDDYMSRAMNALPQIRVVLSLVDARWAAAVGK